ncbi:hypothetical protein L0337_18855 [candidate division KSB1 bacterium]|nr:hypothetical protein [candidate division KSB1 bacterium]
METKNKTSLAEGEIDTSKKSLLFAQSFLYLIPLLGRLIEIFAELPSRGKFCECLHTGERQKRPVSCLFAARFCRSGLVDHQFAEMAG